MIEAPQTRISKSLKWSLALHSTLFLGLAYGFHSNTLNAGGGQKNLMWVEVTSVSSKAPTPVIAPQVQSPAPAETIKEARAEKIAAAPKAVKAPKILAAAEAPEVLPSAHSILQDDPGEIPEPTESEVSAETETESVTDHLATTAAAPMPAKAEAPIPSQQQAGMSSSGAGGPTSGPAQGLGAGTDPRQINSALSAYLAAIRSEIEQNLNYPVALRRRGITGQVNLRLLLNEDGSLSEVRIGDRPSHAELAQIAADAALRAAPFARFPAEIKKMARLSASLTIDFRMIR